MGRCFRQLFPWIGGLLPPMRNQLSFPKYTCRNYPKFCLRRHLFPFPPHRLFPRHHRCQRLRRYRIPLLHHGKSGQKWKGFCPTRVLPSRLTRHFMPPLSTWTPSTWPRTRKETCPSQGSRLCLTLKIPGFSSFFLPKMAGNLERHCIFLSLPPCSLRKTARSPKPSGWPSWWKFRHPLRSTILSSFNDRLPLSAPAGPPEPSVFSLDAPHVLTRIEMLHILPPEMMDSIGF